MANWVDSGKSESEAVSASSFRGRLPYSGALAPAISNSRLGVERQALRQSAAVGSGNFHFTVPVANYPSRGHPLSLALHYNSRVWQRLQLPQLVDVRYKMVFNIDNDWPAPGWRFNFPQMLNLGHGRGLLVDGDGTRHPFTSREEAAGDRATNFRTTDGSLIDYDVTQDPNNEDKLLRGFARYPDGSVVEFGEGSTDALYPRMITDRNGNMVRLGYRDIGEIDSVTDTCSRVFRFHYDSGSAGGRLIAITGPGLDGTTRELLRLHYTMQTLDHSFGGPEIQYVEAPGVPISLIDAILIPGTHSGYAFYVPGDYSSYGMLRRVRSCRGMSLTGGSLGDQGVIHAGQFRSLVEYDYPKDPGIVWHNTPTYNTMVESWVTPDLPWQDPRVTTFSVTRHQTGSDVRYETETVLPDGSSTLQIDEVLGLGAHVRLPTELLVRDSAGKQLRKVTTTWEEGFANTPRVRSVAVVEGRNPPLVTLFESGPWNNQVTGVVEYGYDSEPRRATYTDYADSRPDIAELYRVKRHILNLPLNVWTVWPGYGNWKEVSREEYEYDQHALQPTPNVGGGGFNLTFDPDEPAYYDADTRWRGNVTLIRRYVDAENKTGVIETTHKYDLCGNLVLSERGGRRVVSTYPAETMYSLPTEIVVGGPSAQLQMRASVLYDKVGLPRTLTDCNGLLTEIDYEPGSLRTSSVRSLATGAAVSVDYDDSLMVETRQLLHGPNGDDPASKEVRWYDGKGRLGRIDRVIGAFDSEWSSVKYQYDERGRLIAETAPHRLQDSPVWDSRSYDPLGRLLDYDAPDGTTSRRFYDEEQQPDNAVGLHGLTVRVVDQIGRGRWVQLDALGRVQFVVAPDPAGAGNVLPSGAILAAYAYDPLDNMVESAIIQRAQLPQSGQTRSFRYDSLSRLTHIFIPERGKGLTNEGERAKPPDARWSEVFTYDEWSNLTSRTDSRGITTRYDYDDDPFDRVQQITYDMTHFVDDMPALPCPDVLYTYEQSGDLTRIQSETVVGVSEQTNTYDAAGRLASTSITMASLPQHPFRVDYGYDDLGRIETMTYPMLYGDGDIRPVIKQQFGLGHAVMNVYLDDVDENSNTSLGEVLLASQFTFNAAGQPTSLSIGPPDPLQVTEHYAYDDWYGWLLSQQLVGQSGPLLDLEYDYDVPQPAGQLARSAQVQRCTDRLGVHSRKFDYDTLGRLKRVSEAGSSPLWSQTYSYDPFGNRTSVTASGQANVADGNALTTYEEPSTNRIFLAHAEVCDAAGNQVAGREPGTDIYRLYQHDAAGRLALVADYGDPPPIVSAHMYGADHRRRASRAGADGPVTYYVWSGDQVIAEYVDKDPDGQHDVEWTRNYMFLGQRLLANRRRSGTSLIDSVLTFEHPDRIGTRFLTGPEGNQDILVLPYGTAETPGVTASHAFTTYARDIHTQLDYAVNRFYDRGTGRFLEPDPLILAYDSMNPLTLNAYAYVVDDPTNLTDPLALDATPSRTHSFDPVHVYGELPRRGFRPAPSASIEIGYQMLIGKGTSFSASEGEPEWESSRHAPPPSSIDPILAMGFRKGPFHIDQPHRTSPQFEPAFHRQIAQELEHGTTDRGHWRKLIQWTIQAVKARIPGAIEKVRPIFERGLYLGTNRTPIIPPPPPPTEFFFPLFFVRTPDIDALLDDSSFPLTTEQRMRYML
jgi:RHS repeat-associated protein